MAAVRRRRYSCEPDTTPWDDMQRLNSSSKPAFASGLKFENWSKYDCDEAGMTGYVREEKVRLLF